MEKNTVRRFSLLGMVLMGASALTAAIVPSKEADNQTNSVNNGTLRQFSGGDGAVANVLSCVTIIVVANCHKTVTGEGTLGTGTTNDDGDVITIMQTSSGNFYTTANQTSRSRSLVAGDTTSVLNRI
jgi:hypothetical protein